jgi:gas vesicle structural protein
LQVQRASGSTSVLDVLDRVLDKGIVIDAWVRVSLMGIDLITIDARVVVASIETYQTQIGEITLRALAANPAGAEANGWKSKAPRCAKCHRPLGAVDHVMFMHGDLFHDQCWRELQPATPLHFDSRAKERVPA